MREAGFDVQDPNALEGAIQRRLDAITGGRTVPLEQLSPEQLAALEELQDYERRLAVKSLELEEAIVEPVEERVEKELLAQRLE
jgi:hypothetical protein